MEINVTLGQVQLHFIPSSTTPSSPDCAPKIHATDNELEKTVELFNFTGTIKIKSSDGATLVKTKLVHSGKQDEQRQRLKKLHRAMNSIKASYGIDPSDAMTTPLHTCCCSKTPRVQEMETILNSNPKLVYIPDKNRNLPIHLLSCNENLFQRAEDFEQVDAFANKLLQEFPESIIMKNTIGYIPFVQCINQWIDRELSNADEGTIITPQLIPGLHDFYSSFPVSLQITPRIEWCIMKLSSAMGQNEDNIFCEIAKNVASINFLIKTILLIDCRSTRHNIMNTTLFKRAILDQKTAGLWIVPMLRAGEQFSSRCIDYFQMVSMSTVANFIGRKRIADPSDIELFHKCRSLVYKRIGKSKYFIPSLCLLSPDEKKKAAQTSVIKEIIATAVNDRFVFSIFRNDIFQLISLLISFRIVSFTAGVVGSIPKAKQLRADGKLFENVQYDLYICMAINSYLVMRKISQAFSLMSISYKFFWKTLVTTWYIQISTITMTFVSVGVIFVNSENTALVLSLTSGLMWISLIYLVQRLVKPMHHFTIVWKMILGNIWWYWLVLAIAIFIVGDMMHIYTTNSGECDQDTYGYKSQTMSYATNVRRLAGEQDFFSDVDMTSYAEPENEVTSTTDWFENYNERHPFCNSDIRISYGVVSAILLGSFNPQLFLQSRFRMYLFFIFSYLVGVFLVTLLISIVNEYYEKLKDKAEEELGRKRIDFAGEQVMLKNSITSEFEELTLVQKAAFIYHWLVLASTFILYGVMCYLYTYQLKNDTASDGIDYHGIFGTKNNRIAAIVVQIVLLGINQVLLFDVIYQYFAAKHDLLMAIRTVITTPIRLIFPHVEQLTQNIGFVLDQDDETGQLLSYERSIKELVERSEKRVIECCKKTEENILSNGEEIKYCLADLLDVLPKKSNDDSSCSSDGSSHDEFTRSAIGLSYHT